MRCERDWLSLVMECAIRIYADRWPSIGRAVKNLPVKLDLGLRCVCHIEDCCREIDGDGECWSRAERESKGPLSLFIT